MRSVNHEILKFTLETPKARNYPQPSSLQNPKEGVMSAKSMFQGPSRRVQVHGWVGRREAMPI